MALSARCPLGPARELAAALAGPAVNLLCAWICSGLGEAWWCFTGLHLALGLFNLLPVGPLDGGRALSCLLTLAGREDWAQPVVGLLSVGLSMGLTMGGAVAVAGRGGQPDLAAGCSVAVRHPAAENQEKMKNLLAICGGA